MKKSSDHAAAAKLIRQQLKKHGIKARIRAKSRLAMRMLQFENAPNRRVFWDGTWAGTIEPMNTKAQPWAYIPEPAARRVPNGLRRPIYRRTQREIKSRLRRLVRSADTG